MRAATRLGLAVLLSVAFGQAAQAASHPGKIIRGIYCRPGPAVDNRLWTSFGLGYDIDTQEKRSGRASIRCSNTDRVVGHGACQRVVLNQDQPRPLVVAGWAKLEGVSGPASYRCSVYLDLRLQNGKSWPMKIAAFDPAKKGWQYATQTYMPPAAIASASVYAFLRQAEGTAWFDDIYVGQIVDDQGTKSPNLLEDPGFEGGLDGKRRGEFFGQLEAIGCNAFHFYKGVPWDRLMEGGRDGLPAIDPEGPLLDFVREGQARGLKVWLTVGAPRPPIKDAQSPHFPYYACVNQRWGETYTRAVAYFAQYGFDGIGVVPDEWTWTTGRHKRAYANHRDPAVAAFYKGMPSYCDCAVCKAEFQKRYGMALPDMAKPWAAAGPASSRFVDFRYACTSAWMERTVAAAKRVNPNVITDTMICVLPVCSDNRIGAGAAWDEIGVKTRLDCLQTDPYIQLHNYLRDSTHYYTTETAIHLTSANWQRWSGVTLEACRLRDTGRHKEPAEVYGAALSCLVHGAREFFWWHMSYLLGQRAYVEPDAPRSRVTAAYEVMKQMEPFVLDAAPAQDMVLLYSRRSEDTWDRLGKQGRLKEQFGEDADPKRGFVAHKHALYWLLRRGYPFAMTYLDNPDPRKLAAARVAIVPFPFALREQEALAIRALAERGATVVLMSELSPRGEWGEPLPIPRLAALFGSGAPARDAAGPVAARCGKGKVVFVGGDFARGLFVPIEEPKDRVVKPPLPAFDATRAAALESVLSEALGPTATVLAGQPSQDVEATMVSGPRGRVLLAINWETEGDATVVFRPHVSQGFTEAAGYSINAAAQVTPVRHALPANGLRLTLTPQEAVLLHLR